MYSFRPFHRDGNETDLIERACCASILFRNSWPGAFVCALIGLSSCAWWLRWTSHPMWNFLWHHGMLPIGLPCWRYWSDSEIQLPWRTDGEKLDFMHFFQLPPLLFLTVVQGQRRDLSSRPNNCYSPRDLFPGIIHGSFSFPLCASLESCPWVCSCTVGKAGERKWTAKSWLFWKKGGGKHVVPAWACRKRSHICLKEMVIVIVVCVCWLLWDTLQYDIV